MLHQKIPPYQGNKPFAYICYCPEDEFIAFPIVARLYNEGVRFWCVNASGLNADFRSIQRLGSASCIIMFMSKAMALSIKEGNAEYISAARSATLRTVILLDEYEPDSKSFAMSNPERISFRTENDASFWLYMYSADHLELCRGSWPEKKVMLRSPGYDDVSEHESRTEYSRLEGLISKKANNSPKNSSYYSEEYGEAEKERLLDNFGKVVQPEDKYFYVPLEKLEINKTESERQYESIESIVKSSINEETLPEPPAVLKNDKVRFMLTDEPIFEFVPAPETDLLMREHTPEIETKQNTVSESDIKIKAAAAVIEEDLDTVTVPVLVKKQRRSKVPVKYRPVPTGNSLRLSATSDIDGMAIPPISDTISFEQYVRTIALSAIEAQHNSNSDDVNASSVPKQKRRRISSVNTIVPVNVEVPVGVDIPVSNTAALSSELTGEEDKPSPRKNKHPHRSGILSGLISLLRSERDNELKSTAVGEITEIDEETDELKKSIVIPVEAKPVSASVQKPSPDLKSAVNKFLELEGDESFTA